MSEKPVSVEVEETVWQRVKVRAASEKVPVKKLVDSALRLLLASPVLGTGSVAAERAEDPPPAADVRQRQTTALDLSGIPNDGLGRTSGPDDGYRGQPRTPMSPEDLKRLVKAKTGLDVRTAREVQPNADGSVGVVEVTVPFVRSVESPVDPREAERARRAAQDRLRTHPEDDSQDPDLDF